MELKDYVKRFVDSKTENLEDLLLNLNSNGKIEIPDLKNKKGLQNLTIAMQVLGKKYFNQIEKNNAEIEKFNDALASSDEDYFFFANQRREGRAPYWATWSTINRMNEISKGKRCLQFENSDVEEKINVIGAVYLKIFNTNENLIDETKFKNLSTAEQKKIGKACNLIWSRFTQLDEFEDIKMEGLNSRKIKKQINDTLNNL